MHKIDIVDVSALILLLVVFTFASFGGISLETEIVRMTIYAALIALFGTKVLKVKNNGN